MTAKTTATFDKDATVWVEKVGGRPFSFWYDRSSKMWTMVERDYEGNQVGEASYSPMRPTRELLAQHFPAR